MRRTCALSVVVAAALLLASCDRPRTTSGESESEADAASGPLKASTPWRNGVDYITLLPPVVPAHVPQGKIEVVEAFSYECGVCFRFEPSMSRWLASKPEYVEFKRMHVVWRPMHLAHARLFYALKALGRDDLHGEIFNAIHVHENLLFVDEDNDRTFNLQLKFAIDHGVDAAEFTKTYNSEAVNADVEHAREFTRRYLVDSSPTIIVNGKYTSGIARVGIDHENPRASVNYDRLITLTSDLAAEEYKKTKEENAGEP